MDVEELGRRAVACKGWRWMAGMLVVGAKLTFRVTRVDEADGVILGEGARGELVETDEECPPDLTDPATLGCLLALVREAWGRPDASVTHRTRPLGPPDGRPETYWSLSLAPPRPWPPVHGETEAEALVLALEAAP